MQKKVKVFLWGMRSDVADKIVEKLTSAGVEVSRMISGNEIPIIETEDGEIIPGAHNIVKYIWGIKRYIEY